MLKNEWQIIYKFLKEKFPKDVNLWLRNVEYINSSENQIQISVPNEIHKNRFKMKYILEINQFMEYTFKKKFSIMVMTSKDANIKNIDFKNSINNYSKKDILTENNNLNLESSSDSDIEKQEINKLNTFDEFVVGSNNHLAYAAALRISKYPGKDYNPFFIYGEVGLGKTHLMQSIQNYIKKKNILKSVLYITTEQFTNEFINAIKKNVLHHFRLRHRNADIVLIDDIQFLENKEGIQEELFHTFNQLKENSKQMVFTSDKPPKELKKITERLLSRFSSGLIVDIKPPNLETRKLIIQKKCLIYDIKISNEIVDFIAENITQNIRNIEASLLKIKSIQILLKQEITISNVKNHLKDILGDPFNSNLPLELIFKIICNYYSISIESLKSSNRKQVLLKPRQISIYLLRKLCKLCFADIGKQFGRSHSTILISYQKIENQLKENNISTTNDIEQLTNKIMRDFKNS